MYDIISRRSDKKYISISPAPLGKNPGSATAVESRVSNMIPDSSVSKSLQFICIIATKVIRNERAMPRRFLNIVIERVIHTLETFSIGFLHSFPHKKSYIVLETLLRTFVNNHIFLLHNSKSTFVEGLLVLGKQSQSPQERVRKVFEGALRAEMENTNFPQLLGFFRRKDCD